jgi:uncharacterized membrane-anchored protein YhcB (DUF1043 family)
MMMAATTGGRERRKFPWELVIIGILVAVAIGLLIYAFLPPTPPPYVK